MGVLLHRAPRIDLHLLGPAQVFGRAIPAGAVTVVVARSGLLINGQPVGSEAEFIVAVPAGQPAFSTTVQPPFGKAQSLRLEGRAVVRAVGAEVELIERLPMERYLTSVVSAEMNPTWPEAALAAQAIAARSYASARWLERFDQPWQLHWHYSVDMAYAGWRKPHPTIDAAIARTRGELLIIRGLPVQALFHASSGGRTESALRLKPHLIGPDGRTPVADAMVPVDDPAAEAGAAGLKLSASHWRWKVDIPLAEVSADLQTWSRAQRGRPAIGTVVEVRPGERSAESRRVITVRVTHRHKGKMVHTELPSTEFRLALSPVQVRSTWWDRCVIASAKGGTLVLEGRGFGHGVGLSQISAWQLAKQGVSPEDIVARFYAGARIEKRW